MDPSLYRWSAVPQGKDVVTSYIDAALTWRDAGTAVPFAIVRMEDGCVIGSTRFWNLSGGCGRRATRDVAANIRTSAKSAIPG